MIETDDFWQMHLMQKYCPSCGSELVNPDVVTCPACEGAIRQNSLPNIDEFSNLPKGISIQGINLSLGNLISLVGAFGGSIAIFLPWIIIVIPLFEKQMISLYGLSDIFKVVSQLVYVFNQGSVHAYISSLSYSWFILLCLLLLCGYCSISGRGKLVHIGIGLLQIGILALFYRMFLGISGYISKIVSIVPGLITFQIGYGFYIALICALLLIIGGIYEFRE